MPRTETDKLDILDQRLSSLLGNEDPGMDLLFASSEKTKAKEYQPGKIVFSEDEEPAGIYLLKQGRIKLSRTGKLNVKNAIGFVSPPCYLGLCSIIRNKKHTSTAITVENCSIDFMPRQEFLKIMSQYPSISHKLLVGLCKLLDSTQAELASLDKNGISKKIAETLSILFHAEQNEGNKVITISARQLADLAGTTEEIAKGCLFELKNKKIISTKGNEITLIDYQALNKL